MSKTKVAVVTAWYAPYRVPLLREISKSRDIDLTVIYCSQVESDRIWPGPKILPFNAVFLKPLTIIRYKYRNMFDQHNSIRYPVGLLRTLRRANPDVVVGYEFRLECILAGLYALLSKRAYVTWSDVTEIHDSRMGAVRKLVRKVLLSKSRALIGSSSDTLDYFHRSFGFPVERLFLSILSAHVDQFTGSVTVRAFSKQKSNGNVRFLYVGRLIRLKGLDLLISAFSELRKKFPNAILTLVGDGPERQSLQVLANKLGCGHDVVFKGDIPYDHVPKEMIAHDVLVFPTRLDVFGLVVAEAIACGLPVICSCWAGAARDLVQDNGIVVDPMDTTELVAAMEKLASDPDLRSRMALANEFVLHKHNLKTATEGFLAAFGAATS